jgi:hypothetical protein
LAASADPELESSSGETSFNVKENIDRYYDCCTNEDVSLKKEQIIPEECVNT